MRDCVPPRLYGVTLAVGLVVRDGSEGGAAPETRADPALQRDERRLLIVASSGGDDPASLPPVDELAADHRPELSPPPGARPLAFRAIGA
jgi:hypothetical protein